MERNIWFSQVASATAERTHIHEHRWSLNKIPDKAEI